MSRMCVYEDCNTRPSYNNEGESKPLYCAKHKLEDMINVINKPCIHQDCNKRPYFNYEGESKPLYCSTHQLEGMINVRNMDRLMRFLARANILDMFALRSRAWRRSCSPW